MDFFTTVQNRRSIRRFTNELVPDTIIQKALDAAVLAPNSSNTQIWNFYWAKSDVSKKRIAEICLNQSAARTAQQLVVVTTDPKLWRRSQGPLVKYVESVSAPEPVQVYYKKLIPISYRWGLFNCLAPLKWLLSTLVGFFRPMVRGPYTKRDLQEVGIKSAALAAENFVLAITAQGYDSCMMEGFDKCRLHRFLKLKSSEAIVMVIGIGKGAERGTWGPRFRLDSSLVIKEI
jgi:nitroreductase